VDSWRRLLAWTLGVDSLRRVSRSAKQGSRMVMNDWRMDTPFSYCMYSNSYLQTDVELADSWCCSSSPASFSKFMYSYLQTCVALVDSWWRWSIVQELVQVELRWVKGKQQRGAKGGKKGMAERPAIQRVP
jgi:hypothetical protein